MNKKVKVLIIIMSILIIILILALIFLGLKNKNNYDNRKVIQTIIQSESVNENFTQSNSIELEDLKVELTGINYFPEGNEIMSESKNLVTFTVDFETINEVNISSVSFDYLIFNDNNNILNTSLWGNLQNTKSYIKGFLNEKYQENQISKFNDYCIFNTSSSYDNITNDLHRISKTMISSLNEELVNTKKINVRIINLKYKKEGQEEKKLENTDLEFILDFK